MRIDKGAAFAYAYGKVLCIVIVKLQYIRHIEQTPGLFFMHLLCGFPHSKKNKKIY